MTPVDITLLVATATVLLVGSWAVTGAVALLRIMSVRGRMEIFATAAVFYTVTIVAGFALS